LLRVILQGLCSLLTIRLQRIGLLLPACLGLLPICHPVRLLTGLLHAVGFTGSRA
jgi:hypothetical protein